jgi:protein ImuA
MSATAQRSSQLASLKARIRAIERPKLAGCPVVAIAPEVDASLPWSGLPLHSLHEIIAAMADKAAATRFLLHLLRPLMERGPIVWAGAIEDLYGPGLALPPERLILARTRNDADTMWAMEESLRCPEVGAVIGEVRGLDLTAARRLQLACETGGTTGFILRPLLGATSGAACTRWRVAAAPVGQVHLTLEHCRGGTPEDWTLRL